MEVAPFCRELGVVGELDDKLGAEGGVYVESSGGVEGRGGVDGRGLSFSFGFRRVGVACISIGKAMKTSLPVG